MSARDVIARAISEDITNGWVEEYDETADACLKALTAAGFSIVHKDEIHAPSVERKFKLGDCVTKVKGSMWTGFVVGFYSTDLTPVGYCVESDRELGSVQIYPEAALRELMKEVGR